MSTTQTRPETTTSAAPATTPTGGSTSSYGSAAATTSTTARTLTVVAFVLAAIAVFFLPPVFGVAGIVCASIAMVKRDPLAKWALTASIAGLIVGMVLGYLVLRSRH